MNLALSLPLLLGCIAILQGSLNKNIINEIGITWMAFLGCAVTMVICTIYFIIAKYFPTILPELMKVQDFKFKNWYIIPGIFGFFFVLVLPIAILKVGAIKTTVGLIAAQMITSVFWDKFVEGYTLSSNKLIGVVLAMVSVIMISMG